MNECGKRTCEAGRETHKEAGGTGEVKRGLDRRTVLIGLDGASFTVLDHLMEEGTMPFLKRFLSLGCRGELTSVVPPLTPPAWISLVTGCAPGAHGVFNFLQFESPKSRYIKWLSFRDIRRETIWSIVNRHGMRAGSLNFIGMNPPPAISGYMIPGFVSWRWLRKNSHPEDLFDRLRSIPGFDAREMALNFREEEKAVKGCQREEYEDWIRLHIRRERQWFDVVRHLMKTDPCHLTAVVFDGMDRIQHVCWRFLDPAYALGTLQPWEEKVRQLCLEYYRNLDGFLEEIVSIAGSEASIFMASDHGFGPTREIVYINQWLHDHGYLEWKGSVKPAGGKSSERQPEHSPKDGKPASNQANKGNEDLESLGVESPYRSLLHLDWKKTKAYAATASSNGIIIQVAGKRGEEGIRPEEYETFREELMHKLLTDCRDPKTGEALITKIWTREEAFAGDYLDCAPDLTLVLRDSGFISIYPSDVWCRPRQQVMGTHRPEGIFAAVGPGIRGGGQTLSPLSIIQVAPAMLYTLGIPIPSDMDGAKSADLVMARMFDPEYLRKRPVEKGEPSLLPERYQDPPPQTEDAEGQEQIMLRLKSLGYV
ncbi:MAG: alkaline phosphatase family protein [bacterium]